MQPPSQGFAGKEILLIVALVLGVLTALGYAAHQRVRQSSQDKAVLCVVRQLAAAADQYYLENAASTVALRELVGPQNYIKAMNTVAGETYPLAYTQGVTITVRGVAGARTVTYAP